MNSLPSALITDRYELLTAEESDLLSRCEEAVEIEVVSLVGEGFSGARVILANVTYRENAMQVSYGGPNFIKIDAEWRTADEIRFHERAESTLPGYVPALIVRDIGPENGRAAVIYAPAAHTTLNVRSLAHLSNSGEYSPEYIAAFLERVVGVLTTWNREEATSETLTAHNWLVNILNAGSKSGARAQEASQLGIEITGGTPTRIAVAQTDRILPNPAVFITQANLWASLDQRISGPLGRIHGDLHGGNILCRPNDPTLNPWLIDFARFLENGPLFYDLAYLELDIATERLSEISLEDWKQYTDVATKDLSVIPRHFPARGAASGAYRCILPIRQYLRNFIEKETSAALGEQYQAVWWLTLAGVALLYARRERYANRPHRLFNYLYAAYALDAAFRVLGYQKTGELQSVDFAVLVGAAQTNVLRDAEIAYADKLLAELGELDNSVVDLEGSQWSPPPRSAARLSDRVRMRLKENITPPILATVMGATSNLAESAGGAQKVRDAVRQAERAVILGEPGSGKTTIILRLTLEYARDLKQNAGSLIPVFLPLAQYDGRTEAEFIAFAQSQMADLSPTLAARLVALFDARRIILLCDGLNEMPRMGDRTLRSAKAILNRANRAVVTCRAREFEDLGLQDMTGFNTITLRELTPPLIRQIINQYIYQGVRDEWTTLTDAQRRYLWHDLLMGSDDLISAWEKMVSSGTAAYFWMPPPEEIAIVPDQDVPGVAELNFREREARRKAFADGRGLLLLCRSPFMLTLIIDMYRTKGRISGNTGAIFKEFVDLLFERERESSRRRGEMWPLGYEAQLAEALSRFATEMHLVRGANSLARAEAVSMLGGEAVLQLLTQLGLLRDDGAYIQFTHGLLQGYFAGRQLEAAIQNGFPAKLYWKAENWWESTPHDYVLSMLIDSFADRPDQVAKIIAWLAPAQPELALLCLTDTFTQAHIVRRETKRALVDSAKEKAEGKHPAGREAAYRVLGRVDSDKRPGVGLRRDGLPDIVWQPVEPPTTPITVTRPRGIVLMPEFYVAKYPVTYAQYSAFLEAEDGYRRDDWWGESLPMRPGSHLQKWPILNHPVENVTWYSAEAFCRWLTSRLKAAGYTPPRFGKDWVVRLPTEEEWQLAATGGDDRAYPYGAEHIQDAANILGIIGQTSAVGIMPRDCAPCGACDIAGNVYEWTASRYDADYTAEADDKALRVVRGGSWRSVPTYTPCLARRGLAPNVRDDMTGFRMVLAKPQ